MMWGSVGINGHFTFNEPPKDDENYSNEEFAERPTRVLTETEGRPLVLENRPPVSMSCDSNRRQQLLF